MLLSWRGNKVEIPTPTVSLPETAVEIATSGTARTVLGFLLTTLAGSSRRALFGLGGVLARGARKRMGRTLLVVSLVGAVATVFTNRKNIARAFRRRKRLQEIDHLRKVMSTLLAPDEAAALQYKIGRIFQESLQDYAKAVDAFETLLRESPNSFLCEKAQYNIGICYDEMGRPDAARVELRKVISEHPNGALSEEARIKLEAISDHHGEGPVPAEPTPPRI